MTNKAKTKDAKSEHAPEEKTSNTSKKTKERQDKTTKLRLACSPNNIIKSRTQVSEIADIERKGKKW